LRTKGSRWPAGGSHFVFLRAVRRSRGRRTVFGLPPPSQQSS
jgi:hypothetical protein